MNLEGTYILLRLYLDAFSGNNPIGSSSGNHKIMGFYYSPFVSAEAGSKRATIQTLALLFQKDIDHFSLNVCLKSTMDDLKCLVLHGIYDEKIKRNIDIRIIFCLGNNLEQVNVAGIRPNFSSMQYSCCKCMCSKDDKFSAEK